MIRILISLILFINQIHSQNVEFPKTKRDYWPTSDWRVSTPEKQNLDSSKLNLALEYAFKRTGNEKDRSGIRTDSVIIVKNGYIVAEKYARGYDANKPHLSWSVAKAFVNALFGIAENKGLLNRKDPAYKYFSELEKEGKKDILIEHLLTMSSGLDWNEGYESSPLNSSVIQMLYTIGKRDMAMFTAKRDLKNKPGTYNYYSSGDSNLLMGILKNILNEKYNSFPEQNLYSKIGIKNVIFEKDSSGTFIGSSYIYMTPRDFAKFGYLYLNGGVWDKERILSEDWMKFTTTLSPAFGLTPTYPKLGKDMMSAHWFVNTGYDEKGYPPLWPKAPADTFATSGHWGQKILVIPSLDMLVCIFGDQRDETYSENDFLNLVLESVKRNK